MRIDVSWLKDPNFEEKYQTLIHIVDNGTPIGYKCAVYYDSEILVFALGVDDNIAYMQKYNGTWNGWQSLGCCLVSDISVVKRPNNLSIFARGTDNAIWNRIFNGTAWNTWSSLYGNLSDAPVAIADDDDIYVFARDWNRELYYVKSNESSWGDWIDMEGELLSKPVPMN